MEAHLKAVTAGFENRELKGRFGISHRGRCANFKASFTRIAEKLKTEYTTVAVEKTGRGKFALIVNGEPGTTAA